MQYLQFLSPSSRRAWIEIASSRVRCGCGIVALLAEGVDRNMYPLAKATRPLVSPSSRRAWIEIAQTEPGCLYGHVVLLAEGVDRN